MLSQQGFDTPPRYVTQEENAVPGGEVRDISVALSTLRDTRQAGPDILLGE